MIYHSKWCQDADALASRMPEILQAEMRIDEEIIPRIIWLKQYWEVEGEKHITYTLTVTDELLEMTKNQRY